MYVPTPTDQIDLGTSQHVGLPERARLRPENFLLSQADVLYRTQLNLSSRFPVRYGTVHYLFCFMRPVVVFYHYPWNNQVFYYGTGTGTVPYSTVLIHFSRLLRI